jgi:DNA-binding NarL/FixJ family response regulator
MRAFGSRKRRPFCHYATRPGDSKSQEAAQRDLREADRQREIAALVCAGHPSKTIARKLRISEGTMHVRSGHDCKRWYLRPMIDYLVD